MTISLDALNKACKAFGIEQSWIGDCNQHTWVINNGAESSMLCDSFTIEKIDEGKNGITFYGIFPKVIDSDTLYARWEWSEKKGILFHKETCVDNCDCMDMRSLIDLMKGICATDILTDVVKNAINGLIKDKSEDTLSSTAVTSDSSDSSEYPAQFDEIIDHDDYEIGCVKLGVDRAWVRDGKAHSWEINHNDDGKIKKQTVNKWTIDVDIIIEKNKKVLYFYGEFLFTKDSIKTLYDAEIYHGLELNKTYSWEWTVEEGFYFFLEEP
jgi:hypothetical protein